MERRRDYLRPPRHDPRLTVAAATSGDRATIDADSTAMRLSRRRLIMLGAGAAAAAGDLATLSPQRAAAVLRLDVTQATCNPCRLRSRISSGLECRIRRRDAT